MAIVDNDKYRAITSVLNLVQGSCALQFQNKDVAIPYLQGLPGLGKTMILADLFKRLDWNMQHIHFALLPIEDLSGIPQFTPVDEETITKFNLDKDTVGTSWSLPALITSVYETAKNGKPTVMFLDDFHLCSPAHLELMFEMFTEGTLRGFPFPPNVAFVLAGNDSAKSGAKVQFAAIGNRLASYPVSIDFDAWRAYAAKSGVNEKIVAFLSKDVNRKHIQEPELVNEPFGSARSWTRFSSLLNPLEEFAKNGISTADLLYISKSHIGSEAASKFVSFYKLFSAVNTVAMFKGQIPIDVPTEMDKSYIFMMACCAEFSNAITAQYVNKNKVFPVQEYYNIMGKILIAIGKTNKDLALVGIKEILITAKIHTQATGVATRIKSSMIMVNEELTKGIYGLINELA